MENDSKEYQQGFNEGYIVAQHLPELANNLSKVKSTSPRIEGFKDGHEQLLLEQIRELRLDKDNRNQEKNFDDPTP